jgi:ABC-type sugar transport system ATPase subunit
VDVVEPLGDETVVHGSINGPPVAAPVQEDEFQLLQRESRATVVARLGPRERPDVGSTLRVSLDPELVHVFDAGTGEVIR